MSSQNVTLVPQRLEFSSDGWLTIQWVTPDLSSDRRLSIIESRFNKDFSDIFLKQSGVSAALVHTLRGKKFIGRIYQNRLSSKWLVDPESVTELVAGSVDLNKSLSVKPVTTSLATQLSKLPITTTATQPTKDAPQDKVEQPKVVTAVVVKPAVINLPASTVAGKRGADTKVIKIIRNGCDSLLEREFFLSDRPELAKHIAEIRNILNAELAK